MPVKRPTSVHVLAILSFIHGSLLLLCGLCGGGALALAGPIQNMTQSSMKGPEAAKQRDAQERMQRLQKEHQPNGNLVGGMQAGMQIVLAGLLFFGAVGLLKMKPSGRWLHLVYAVLALLINIAMMAYTLIVALPANDVMMKEMLENATQEEQAMMKMISPFMSLAGTIGVAGTLFWLIHPIATLIILFMPSNAAAFRGEAAPGAQSDEEEDMPRDEPPPWRPGE